MKKLRLQKVITYLRVVEELSPGGEPAAAPQTSPLAHTSVESHGTWARAGHLARYEKIEG